MGACKKKVICLLCILWIGALGIVLGTEHIQSMAAKMDMERVLEARDVYRQSPVAFFSDKSYSQLYSEYLPYTSNVLKDIVTFPIPVDYRQEISYEDSFGTARTYGGDRTHEGTDLMYQENERGIVPIVSMTDGYVKNIGWLTLGGYRIGIQSDSGIYYYYAHLDSYAPGLSKGDEVTSGQLLGFMGDTGYGEEGTKGQFPVHLHLGIYYYDNQNNEISINPFPFLQNIDLFGS